MHALRIMSTRFYAGPVSSGMGRRWDDWLDPEPRAEAWQRRRQTPAARPTPLPAPSPGSPDAVPAGPIDPIAERL